MGGTVWKSSSMSSPFASRVTYVFRVHLEGDCWKASVWYCTGSVLFGDGISSIGVSSSSSSEELKVRHLHTGLQCDSLVPVLHGITGCGSKDAFLTLEMWWILEVLLSGVCMLKFCYPCHSLCLQGWVYFQMWHSGWSQSDQIIPH